MNKFLYSCFLILSLFFVKTTLAQPLVFTVTPASYCYNNGAPLAGQVAITSTGIATNFAFSITIIPPAGCPANSGTVTPDPTSAPSFTLQNIAVSCCGVYNFSVQAVDQFGNPTQSAQSAPNNFSNQYAYVVCPNTATMASSAATNSYICQGSSVTFTVGGGTGPGSTYLWSNGATTSVITVTPSTDQCYTATITAAAGCTTQAASCVSLQPTSLTLTPASQTICTGNTVTVLASASTNSTSIAWYDPASGGPPGGAVIGTAPSQTFVAGAAATVYTAVLNTSGPAGTCTVQATNSVVPGTSVSMTLAASASVCPGAVHTITASPAGATTYTYYTSTTPPSFTSTSAVATVTGPASYTVAGDFQGCPGTASVVVGTASLTPTLSVVGNTNNLTCPGRSITLQAAGGFTYTFVRPSAVAPFTAAIGTPSSTSSTQTTIPASLPITYTLRAGQGGCTGVTTLTVRQATLHPQLVPVPATSSSVCPNTTFTLSASGGLNYTFTPTTAGIPTGTITSNTATSSIPTGSFPVTYSLTADSLGCSNGTTTVIRLRTLTPSLTLSSASVCPGGTFTMTAAGGSGTSYTFTPPTSVALNTIAINQATASVPSNTMFPATFTVVADSAGCVGLATKAIGLLSLNNNLTFAATPSLVCPGNQFTLAAQHAQSYTITAPSGANITYNSAAGDTAYSAYPSGQAFPITYTVAGDSAGCVGIRTTQVQRLYIHPTLSITPSGSVCAGSSITLTASSDNTASPTSYTFAYYPPATTPFPFTLLAFGTNSMAVHHPTTATSYSVIADSSGCTTSAVGVATIGIFPPLPLNLTAVTSTVCSGETTTLNVNSVSNYTYNWAASTGTINNPTDTTAVVNPTVNTTYSVHAIDPGGCVGDASITISINPTASLAISAIASPTAVCPNSTSTLIATSVSAIAYTWTPAASVNPPNSATTTATPSVNTTYTVTGTNNLGCFGAATVNVNVVLIPTVVPVTSAASVCPGYNATLTAYGAISYTWTGVTTSTATGGTSITPVYQQSIAVSPGIYTVVGSNGGSCLSNPTVISVYPGNPLNISVSASPTNTTCVTNNSPKYSKPVVLTASGGSSYSWLPYNPSVMTYSLGPQTTVIPPSSTCYTVIGYTSACSGQTVTCVTVIPQFTMNVVPPLPAMCIGDSIHLNIVNIGSNAVGPASAFTYSWTEPDNQPLTLTDDFSPSVTAWPSATSTYSVEMRDARDCVSLPRLVTVTVYPRPVTAVSIPTIDNVPTNTVCYVGLNPGEGDNVITLTASNANVGLPFGVIPTYTWNAPSDYMPYYNSILTPPNNNVVTVSAPLRTPSVVIYTVTSGYNGIPGCVRYDTVSVRVVDCRPVTTSKIKFTTDSDGGDTLCTRQCITFTSLVDTAAGGPQKYLWTFQGGNPYQSTEKNPTVCYNLPNNGAGYNVILHVENPFPRSTGGSKATRGVPRFIQVYDYPSVTIISPPGIGSDTTVRFGQSVSLSGNGALSYEWYPPYNITSLTNPKVTVNPFQTTQYILTGYNSKKCYSSDTLNVIVIPDCGEMYVPNMFSPNSDGHNDVLYVRGICLQTLTFMVFNRWGEKVFETFDQKVGWDGSYRGEPVNSGVFVYRLEGKTYDGKGFSSKGNITLIR